MPTPAASRTRRWAALALTFVLAFGLATACTDDPPPPAPPAPPALVQAVNPKITTIDYGIEVVRFDGANLDAGLPPIVLVHGGGGDWRAWATIAPRLAATGRTVYAFSWLHHGGSARLPVEVFVRRSILDVARLELPRVVSHALGNHPGHTKVDLVGRSMGGAVALGFTAANPDLVRRLAVLQPVVPATFAPAVIPIPITPFEPGAPGTAEEQHALFYPTLTDDEAYGLYAAGNPESPVAIHEATRWTLQIDVMAIKSLTLVVASDPALDRITPPSSIEAMAKAMKARYETFPGIGHGEVTVKDPHRQRLVEMLTEHLGG